MLENQINEKVFAEQERIVQKYRQVDEETEYLINMNQELQSAIKQMDIDFSQLSNDKQNLERQLSGLKRQYEKE